MIPTPGLIWWKIPHPPSLTLTHSVYLFNMVCKKYCEFKREKTPKKKCKKHLV